MTAAVTAGGVALAAALLLVIVQRLSGLDVFALPFVASAAVVAMAPVAPLAQPAAIVIGYGASGLVAVGVTAAAGPADHTALLAAGASIPVMLLLKAPHAPAVAAAALIGREAPGPAYLVTAVLPAVLAVTLVALAAGRLVPGYRYPARPLRWRRSVPADRE
ncbi:hypothetical protein GCM10023085_39480 [Actinomadura viridis]|uniref:CBS-domain-containing membrane protein n=1 Tax=Actinomadura viridis TaxID=58110 RepID=A0A931DQ83_9ACTN|nr:HPP family protein [Actinomadura viridis]MBG6092769.1 CBS-domain-containing membrane protein [Actinomadura viridis]